MYHIIAYNIDCVSSLFCFWRHSFVEAVQTSKLDKIDLMDGSSNGEIWYPDLHWCAKGICYHLRRELLVGEGGFMMNLKKHWSPVGLVRSATGRLWMSANGRTETRKATRWLISRFAFPETFEGQSVTPIRQIIINFNVWFRFYLLPGTVDEGPTTGANWRRFLTCSKVFSCVSMGSHFRINILPLINSSGSRYTPYQ
jgi:hypothetical protein